MACCGRKNNPNKAIPLSPVPPPAPRAFPTKAVIAKPAPVVITKAPLGSENAPGRFCPKCGWIVAASKYADPTTGKILEKKSCTNRRCSDYR